MVALTELQRLVLATLEEAGNETVSTLINTIVAAQGRPIELAAIRSALNGLLHSGMITLATSRDGVTLQLIPLDNQDALSLLQSLEFYLVWSDSQNVWMSLKDQPCIETMLTDVGKQVTHEILSDDGFLYLGNKLVVS